MAAARADIEASHAQRSTELAQLDAAAREAAAQLQDAEADYLTGTQRLAELQQQVRGGGWPAVRHMMLNDIARACALPPSE